MRSSRRARMVALLLTAPLAIACESKPSGDGGDGRSPKRGGPPPMRTVTARSVGSGPPPIRDAPPQSFGGGAMTVTLDEPGDEPRQPLRYALEAAARKVRLEVQLEPPKGLTLQIGLGLGWTITDGSVAFAVSEASLGSEGAPARGPQKAMFARMREGFEQVRGEAEVLDDRQVQLTQTKGQPTTPPIPWLLQAMTVPLPSEPIGVGAKWTVRLPIDASGRKGRSERTYRLDKRDGEMLTVAIGGTDSWKAAGGRADGTTTPSGTVTVGLSDPLPRTADLTIVEQVEAEGKAPAGRSTLHVALGKP